MDIDIEDLKKKYRKKTQIDLVDLVQLQTMVPVLIREICRLEDELDKVSEYVRILEKKRPPSKIKGAAGKAEWLCTYDMKLNRMFICLKGTFDHKSAKKVSNAVIAMLGNVSRDFDVISDIRELHSITDMKTAFHLKKTRYHMVQAGVFRTVRVVPKKESLVTSLFEKYIQGNPQTTMVVHSLEDAQKSLDTQGKFLNT